MTACSAYCPWLIQRLTLDAVGQLIVNVLVCLLYTAVDSNAAPDNTPAPASVKAKQPDISYERNWLTFHYHSKSTHKYIVPRSPVACV
jgi:hypothetical protein